MSLFILLQFTFPLSAYILPIFYCLICHWCKVRHQSYQMHTAMKVFFIFFSISKLMQQLISIFLKCSNFHVSNYCFKWMTLLAAHIIGGLIFSLVIHFRSICRRCKMLLVVAMLLISVGNYFMRFTNSFIIELPLLQQTKFELLSSPMF